MANVHISTDDLDAMEKRFRALFVNSLAGFKSANLVGTQDAEGNTNLAIVSSVVHLGADPALMAMIARPNTTRRDTLDNIRATGSYTFNHISPAMVKQAHQTSARYPKHVSEFDAVDLQWEHSEAVTAPYVVGSPLAIGMQLEEIQHLAINGTELVIGRIIEIRMQEDAIGTDGFVDIEALGSITVSSLDSYHSTRSLGRLSYAKPDREPEYL